MTITLPIDNQTSQLAFTTAVVVATTIVAYFINKRHFARIPGTSGPQPDFLIGNLRLLAKHKNTWTIWKIVEDYGPFVALWFGTYRIIYVKDPAITADIIKNKDCHEHDPVLNKIIRNLLPGSMLSTMGHDWKRHRKALTPILGNDRLRFLMSKMDKTVNVTIKNIKERIRDTNEPINLRDDFEHMALDIMGYLAFGRAFRDIDGKESNGAPQIDSCVLKEAINTISNEIAPRALGLSLYPYIGDSKKVRDANKELTKAVNILVDEYEANRQKMDENKLEQTEWENFMNRSFIAQVLGSSDGKNFTFEELRGEMITMFLGGTDTTSGTMGYAIKLLSEYPRVQEKLYEEIITVIGKDAIPQYEQLQESSMPYLDKVVKEIQRLSLLISSVGRYLSKESTIGNVVFPKGTTFWLSVASMHRDPKNWKDPLVFLPERWNADGIANGGPVNPKAFMPFGGGPRICFGMRLAALELRFMVVYMVRAFFFKELPPHLKDKVGEEQVIHGAAIKLANVVGLPESRP